MVLMEKFGGKFTALSDVCKLPQGSPLVSRKVRLVSLRRDADGVMWCCPVSWSSGSSDQIGFKAKTPADVLKFLEDPCGKAVLFPDANCGPDVICIFQDEETKELITASWQMKVGALEIGAWSKPFESVVPEYFYIVVCFGGIESR